MADLVMPRLSESMEEGTVLRWLKADGDSVREGEDLVEIETDQATATHQSEQDGVLQIVASEGDTLPIGAVIARVRDSPGAPNGAADAPASAEQPASITAPPAASVPASPAGDTAIGRGEVTLVDLTRTQQMVARRMAESRATVPDFTIQAEIDMEGCVGLRSDLKALQSGAAPTYNDMVVRACALALRAFPRANGSYRDGRFELHSRVNVGVAVAARDALVVPTVFDADVKSLRAIAQETLELVGRVRAGMVTPPELSGATFTVSNLGMFNVASFTAVINPPQAAILSVGALAQRAVVRDGALAARHTMHVTLTCDHRILYGADAAEFLARVRELLERPLALTFDRAG